MHDDLGLVDSNPDATMATEDGVELCRLEARDGRYFVVCDGDGSDEEITHEEYEALARPGGVEKFADWLHNVYIPNAFRAHAQRLPAVLRPVRAPRGPRRRRLRTSRANARAPDDSEPAPEAVAIPLSRFRRDISAWLEAGGRVNCPTGKILEEP